MGDSVATDFAGRSICIRAFAAVFHMCTAGGAGCAIIDVGACRPVSGCSADVADVILVRAVYPVPLCAAGVAGLVRPYALGFGLPVVKPALTDGTGGAVGVRAFLKMTISAADVAGVVGVRAGCPMAGSEADGAEIALVRTGCPMSGCSADVAMVVGVRAGCPMAGSEADGAEIVLVWEIGRAHV